jgi:hypothetical protein
MACPGGKQQNEDINIIPDIAIPSVQFDQLGNVNDLFGHFRG